MNRHTQVTLFWLGALAAFLLVLYVFRGILLPFVAGMALAYAFDPLATWLERRGLGRHAATIVILVAVLIVIALVLLLLVPVVATQLAEFVTRLPTTIEQLQNLASSLLDSEWARFLGLDTQTVRNSITGLLAGGGDLTAKLVPSILTGGLALINVISLFLITPFVAFFVLRDWEKMIARIDSLLPRDHAEEIRNIARQIDRKVAAFVRGQMLSGLILGIFYAVGLVIVGLNYGLLIGLASGIFSFIPYAGFAVGFAVSIVIALVQFWPDWIWIVAVIVVFQLGQLLEGYVLQPRLLGSMVGLHPVWLLFGLFAFGLLFGFVGLLIAVPAAAAVGVLFGHFVERYRKSALFRGTDDPGAL